MKIILIRPVVLMAALLVVPSVATADWMPKYSGSENFGSSTSAAAGVVDFAVFNSTTSTPLASQSFYSALTGGLQTGSGSLAALKNAKYVYMYEVVNTPNSSLNKSTLFSLVLGVNSSDVLAAGSMQTAVSSSNQGSVFSYGINNTMVNNTNLYLGGTANTRGVSGIGTATSSSAIQGTYDTHLLLNGTTPSVGFDFMLSPSSNTSIVFIASDVAPSIVTGNLDGSGSTTSGHLAAPTPEPGTIALFGMAIPLMCWGYARRSRGTAAISL